MTTNNSMTVITSKPFGALNVDVYQNDKHQYYMTREQIGRALECKEPRKYIAKIHERNADRLDSLSTVVNLTTVEGGITKEREIICYSLRGVMEICRLSRQPKADAFMDFCWDIMESLMRGDSVLATPQMDAALSKEFIDVRLHALFDSMKNLQSELDSTRKNLSDQIEEARATSNEALNVISSVSQCVHQIKDKQMDDAIRSKNYTPRNVFREEMSDWRKDMYDRIKAVAKINDMKVEEVMSKIYLYMRDVYGFVIEDERKKFKQKTGRSGHISTIDVVERSDMYKSIFESIVKDLHAEAIDNKKENFFDQPKAIEAAPKADVNVAPVIEVEAKEVEPEPEDPVAEEKPKKQSDTAKYLMPVIEPLAQKLGDKTIHYHKTYRMVYNKIGFTKMENMMKQYKRVHGRTPIPKTKVFLENDKAMRMFKKAVKELMKEQENK